MTTRTVAEARRAAVLGSPIAHSLSPVLHRAAYRELGLGSWSYDRFEVDEATLASFVDGLGVSWAGLSLTMPLKRAVIPLLDEVTATAASVEAVNTVVFTSDGRRVGDNTDIPGMIAAMRERGVEKVESAAVLGAGATASSALAALSLICTGPVTAYVRSAARAQEMRGWGERLGVDVHTADWEDAMRRVRRAAGDRDHPGRYHRRARRRRSRCARHSLRRAVRALADAARHRMAVPRRGRRRRPRSAGAPGSAAGRADDRPDARPAGRHAGSRRAGTRLAVRPAPGTLREDSASGGAADQPRRRRPIPAPDA